MKKLKRAVIKEELVELTGDYKKAIVLNQMIYWSERREDADKFLNEEMKRSEMAMGSEEREKAEQLQEQAEKLKAHGWIYKSATELSEEIMMKVSKTTMGEYLKYLVTQGWLEKRKNPNWKGDNTFQYRVNLVQIQIDLNKIGYSLEGYSALSINETSESNDWTSESKNLTGSPETGQVIQKVDYITRDYFKDSFIEVERDNIIIAILKNYGFEQEDIMHIHSNFASISSNDFKKHLFIEQASDMRKRLDRGEKIYHKPKYFRTGYKVLLEAERHKQELEAKRKAKNEANEEYKPTVPFYNWLES